MLAWKTFSGHAEKVILYQIRGNNAESFLETGIMFYKSNYALRVFFLIPTNVCKFVHTHTAHNGNMNTPTGNLSFFAKPNLANFNELAS